MFITIVLCAIVGAWFALEAESTIDNELLLINPGTISYPCLLLCSFLSLIQFLFHTVHPFAANLAEATSHDMGLLSATPISWQVSKRSWLEVRPPLWLLVLCPAVFVGFVLSVFIVREKPCTADTIC